MTNSGAYLMAYFRPETEPDGEQIRFAVSEPDDPTRWTPIQGGDPILISDVGELGARDPFLVRDDKGGRVVIIATDLRVHPTGDWGRATRWGSRSLVVWETTDLIQWSSARLVKVSGPDAGNTWAPKAFWSETRDCWLVIWASALYDEAERSAGSHQRLMAAPTKDFRTFGPAEVYLDPGHDVIDATFLRDGKDWYRFSANAHGKSEEIGHHIFIERGKALEDPAFAPLRVDVGRPELEHGEGPAVFSAPGGNQWFLLIDEFGLRGYQLFDTDDLASGDWRHRPKAVLPPNARHGSVIPISLDERTALLNPR